MLLCISACLSSSVVEQSAVNRSVTGSNPVSGAIIKRHVGEAVNSPAFHAGIHGFEPRTCHQIKTIKSHWGFFSLYKYYFEKIINGINKLPRYLLEIEKRQELTNKFQENLFTAQKNKTRLGSFQQSDIEAFNQLSKQLNNSIND